MVVLIGGSGSMCSVIGDGGRLEILKSDNVSKKQTMHTVYVASVFSQEV